MKSRPLPAHLHDGARLGASLLSPFAEDRQSALSSLPRPFSNWAPSDALFGLLTLGEAQVSLESSGTSIGTGAAAKITAGIKFAEDWPHSLSDYVKESTKRSNKTSVRSALGPLSKLFLNVARQTPIRDLIRSSISMSFGEAIVPAKVHSQAIVDGTCRDGMLTATEASRQLRISARSLKRLEGRSETFVKRQNCKGGVALYDKAAISRLQDALSNSAKPAACAEQLGIPAYCVEAFISAGLVKVVPNPDAVIVADGNLITNASILELRERLQSQSGMVGRGVTVRQAMRRNGNPEDWVAVFANMLSGSFRFRIADRPGPSFSDELIIEPSTLTPFVSWRSSGPSVRGIDISCLTAAELLGTTGQFISAAVKCGLMVGKVGMPKSALPLDDVLKFQKEFVLTEELCEIFGASRHSIVSQLGRAGLEPATIIFRTTVWKRADIDRYIKCWLRPGCRAFVTAESAT